MIRIGFIAFSGLALLSVFMPAKAAAVEVGDRVTTVELRNLDNKAAKVAGLGKKVVVLFYLDPDVRGQNKPFHKDLIQAKLDPQKHVRMAVVNLKDTTKPHKPLLKMFAKRSAKVKCVVRADLDHSLAKSWKLGNCDQQEVTLIIGKDQHIKYLKRGLMTPTERKEALALVRGLIARK